MFMILRTLFGLVVGWIASAFFALLGRHSQGSLAVRPDRRQFLRNAALGAVGSVLALMGAATGLLLWPRKTGAFGSEITVRAEDVPPVEAPPMRFNVRATGRCTTTLGCAPADPRHGRWTT